MSDPFRVFTHQRRYSMTPSGSVKAFDFFRLLMLTLWYTHSTHPATYICERMHVRAEAIYKNFSHACELQLMRTRPSTMVGRRRAKRARTLAPRPTPRHTQCGMP